jgi:hypothetical protein
MTTKMSLNEVHHVYAMKAYGEVTFPFQLCLSLVFYCTTKIQEMLQQIFLAMVLPGSLR